MAISIVIPHLDDPAKLEISVASLRPELEGDEILVADQGSRPEVLERIRGWTSIRVLDTPGRRAVAMNQAARAATQDLLVFLPLGVHLERGWRAAALKASTTPSFALGWFTPSYPGRHPALCLADVGARLSSEVFKMPSLRQGLMVKASAMADREVFEDLPEFEGWELARRMKAGGRVVRIRSRSFAPSDTYAARGHWDHLRDTARAWNLVRQGGRPTEAATLVADPRRALVLLLTWPEPGQVKTRLAAAVGAETAADVSRALVTRTREEIDRLRFSPTRLVAVSPGDRVEEARRWFGPSWTVFGLDAADPGDRMAQAFEPAFSGGAAKVVAVVADTPGLEAPILKKAYEMLDHAQVVAGPSDDGGYYLLGLDAPHPELFQGIPWGTPQVLEHTFTLASKHSLHMERLPALTDIADPREVVMMRMKGVLQAG
jgi:uncharacterized protein